MIILPWASSSTAATPSSQRRVSQNTSDFAALAGARIVAQWIGDDATNGTDANVQAAINATVAANGGDPIMFGAPDGPTYVDANGARDRLRRRRAAGAPTARKYASGCASRRRSRSATVLPGHHRHGTRWTASSTATARGGYATGGPAGDVFPGRRSALAFFQTYPFCTGDVGDPSDPLPARCT